MKLWKILLATMIALVLVCAVAMAEECTHANKYAAGTNEVGPIPTEGGCVYYTETTYKCPEDGCANWSEVARSSRTEAHVYAGEVRHAETCERGSYYTNKCTVCGFIAEWDGQTEKLGHDYKWVWTKNPTCTEKGYQKLTCSRCGDVDDEAEIATTNHAWEVNTLVPATCTEKGKANYKCADCGKEENEHEVAAKGHEIETKAVTAADCASWGHEVLSYNKCKVCGEVTYKQPKNAYNQSVAEVVNECGKDGHNAHLKCSICSATKDKVVYPAMTHNYALENAAKYVPATCESEGVRVMMCNSQNVKGGYCGDEIEISLPRTGHQKSNDWRVVEAPTCTEVGREQSLCMWCGAVADYRDIPALGHDFYSAKDILGDYSKAYRYDEPECEKDGWAYARCANGCVSDKYVVLPATGHNFWPWDMAAYDCEKGTVGERWCKECNAHETKVFVEGAGHKWLVTAGVDATCEAAGVVDYKCEICGVTRANVYVPAKGHDGEVTDYVAPTCTAEGSKTTKCAECGKTVTETLAKVAHNYEWKLTPATPSANGKNEFKCTGCGDVKETKTVKYTKWYYNNTMTSFGPTTKELVGGNDWYRVTPVDVTVDGVYVYDLVASNKYIVGTVTITVNAGALTVDYKAMHGVEVNDEALLVYASKADLAAGTAVTANVGAAINVAETFGADNQVLVSLILTGNYDAAGKSYVDADAAAALVATID